MNTFTVSGKVWGDIRKSEKTASFRISVYNGKNKDGQSQYFYLTVFAYADSMADSVDWVSEGMNVIVSGMLDVHEHDGKYYTQIRAGMSQIGRLSFSQRQDEDRSYSPNYSRTSFRDGYGSR